MKKIISLEDLLPVKPEFYLKSRARMFEVRPPNMQDKVWLKAKYGEAEAINKIFAGRDWINLTRIVYHHLTEESKGQFLAQKAEKIDDDGNKVMVHLTGPEVLLVSLQGLDESIKMLGAMSRAIALSDPIMEEAIMDSVKKNLKSLNAEFAGEKYLTSSPASTGGRKKK